MNKEMKVIFSIIIAVYNTEEYIAETIESVLAQTFASEAIEIILVNDGSTDDSERICRSLGAKYPFIKVVTKENGGVSSARNMGISDFLAQISRIFTDSIANQHPSLERRGRGWLIMRLMSSPPLKGRG